MLIEKDILAQFRRLCFTFELFVSFLNRFQSLRNSQVHSQIQTDDVTTVSSPIGHEQIWIHFFLFTNPVG